MPSRLIVEQSAFDALCEEFRAAGIVAFDTEFVSEYTYRPELCLMQFATENGVYGVDPFEVADLSEWWAIMADESIGIIVHGGQAEIRFCIDLAGITPQNVIDVQIAEGFRGRSYPLGYDALVSRVLGTKPGGKQTRTDWRRRPLTKEQVDYALADASYLLDVWKKQQADLKKRGRLDWVLTECEQLIRTVEKEACRNPWDRLSGLHRLSPREFAVARSVAQWREDEARNRDRPLRRILRDDLVIDLARRHPTTTKQLEATRDFHRTEANRTPEDLISAISRGLDTPQKELVPPPAAQTPDKSPDEHMLGQLLGIALTSLCAEVGIARQLVGTAADLRHLVRWHLYEERDPPKPDLSVGWRAEVCGDLLTDLLDGKISLRVADPDSDHPLVFDRIDDD
ncbi:ribonuclease D [Stratiformator vulcanicus]|uniref:Ribonuclease D n=1 Tax=Stratiformator vulcanicus TaxID=2527980 RepID=A0A517QZC5_9PLAN|nr:ribonuclease D [Stratiformator vulcanicus]QDT36954.1 Ribonuclease D [Stratiformator vulcanicus]